MTDEDQTKLTDERLIQYTKCRKRILCLESKIKEVGLHMQEMASIMISCPEHAMPDGEVINGFVLKGLAKGDMKILIDPGPIGSWLVTPRDVRKDAKELAAFLLQTEHSHMVDERDK